MTIYNYLKPVWRNGAAVVSDLPPAVVPRVERLLDRNRRARAGEVRVERLAGLGLTVAWLRQPVSLTTGTGYRIARYVHAIVQEDDRDAPTLTLERAEALFEARYGPTLAPGIEAQQEVLAGRLHPEDAGVAAELFIGRAAPVQRPPLESVALPEPVAALDPEPAAAPTFGGANHAAEAEPSAPLDEPDLLDGCRNEDPPPAFLEQPEFPPPMPRSMPLPAMPPASLSALLTYRAPRVFPLPTDPVLEGVVPRMESPGLARAEPQALPLAGQIAPGSSGAV